MRKAIAVSFILLANMIILAHAVVPHHHHNKAFAVIVSLLDSSASEHDSGHHHHGATHHHDGNQSEDCLINEVFVTTFRAQNDDGAVQPPLHIDLDYHPLLAVARPSGTIPLQALPFRQRPYIELIHPIFITHSFGLRAPPFC